LVNDLEKFMRENGFKTLSELQKTLMEA